MIEQLAYLTGIAPSDEMNQTNKSHKIAQVVESTGLSKELIHHYLRQGLLPRPQSRAQYDSRQIRLLLLIKKLREEHNLPLEIVRGLFEVFRFDPDRLEPLVMAEPLAHRLAGLAEGRGLGLDRTLTIEELASTAGISTECIERYVKARLVSPWDLDGERRFTYHDANTISLCERGVTLGIAFEAFRTVASYVRVAFELQHRELFDLGPDELSEGSNALSELFLRREMVAAFVQNVYSALVQSFLHRSLVQGVPRKDGLDSIVYRPSPAFIERHGLEEQLARASEATSRTPDDVRLWRQASQLQLHAGRYREAAFFLEQALERWPDDALLQSQYGIALVLSGDGDRGRKQLEAVVEGTTATPLSRVYLALSLLETAGSSEDEERDMSRETWIRIRDLVTVKEVTESPTSLRDTGPLQFDVRLFGAWILTALPPALRDHRRGQKALIESLAELESAALDADHLPGLRHRYRINAAYLLFECSSRRSRERPMEELESVSLAELRDQICRLDPASAFAQKVFLSRECADPCSNEAKVVLVSRNRTD